MNLFQKYYAKEFEGLPASADAAGEQLQTTEPRIADVSPLVLDIEGAEAAAESTVPDAPSALSIEEVEPAVAQPNPDDALIRELHALLDGITGEPADQAPAAEPAEGPAPEAVPAVETPAQALDVLAFAVEKPADAPAEASPASGEAADEPSEEKSSVPAQEEASAPAPEAEEAEPSDEAPAKQDVLSRDTLTRVSYASVAEAALEKQGQEQTEQRKTRAPIDDETLLAELYALMGTAPKTEQTTYAESATSAPAPAKPSQPLSQTEPQRGITDVERPEQLPRLDEEEQIGGAPGWVKGAFLLMLSLLLAGMTFYAVASDILGKLF